MKKRAIAALAAGLTLAVAEAASAALPAKAPSPFLLCDGYGAPTAAGDGMTAEALSFFIFVPSAQNGDTTKSPTAMSAAGVAACDQALADRRLAARFWLRRVSLLRARAMHQLAIGDHRAALEGLDRAEAAAVDPADPYYRRSLGLGIDYVRAYALRVSGDQKGAEALAMRSFNARPYNRQSIISARLVVGPQASPEVRKALLTRLAQLAPGSSVQALDAAFSDRRYADVVAYQAGFAPPAEIGDEPISAMDKAQLTFTNRLRAGLFETYAGVRTAYALAALGRGGEARTMMLATGTAVAQQNAAMEQALSTLKVEYPAVAARVTREATEAAFSNREMVEDSRGLIEARALVAEGRIESVLRLIEKTALPRDEATNEMIEALIAKVPASETRLLEQLRAFREEGRAAPPAATEGMAELLQSLPDTETRGRVARYKGQNAWVGVDGFKVVGLPDEGDATISFRGLASSPSIVEEMALLRAAELARKKGKSGVLILARKDYQHITNNMMYGMVTSTTQAGHEARLDVAFVDAADLPERYRGAEWRVFDAAEVYEALAPIYAAPRS